VADFGQSFYVCGPEQMVEDLTAHLAALGATVDAVVFEQ
jgi:ferredoxin-NADP reductase